MPLANVMHLLLKCLTLFGGMIEPVATPVWLQCGLIFTNAPRYFDVSGERYSYYSGDIEAKSP